LFKYQYPDPNNSCPNYIAEGIMYFRIQFPLSSINCNPDSLPCMPVNKSIFCILLRVWVFYSTYTGLYALKIAFHYQHFHFTLTVVVKMVNHMSAKRNYVGVINVDLSFCIVFGSCCTRCYMDKSIYLYTKQSLNISDTEWCILDVNCFMLALRGRQCIRLASWLHFWKDVISLFWNAMSYYFFFKVYIWNFFNVWKL